MKVTLPINSKNSSSDYERFFSDASKTISVFANINGLSNYLENQTIEEIIIYESHQEFVKKVSVTSKEDILESRCAMISNHILHLMTPKYYETSYPEGIEPYSYTKLIAHELAHELQKHFCAVEKSNLGPTWFYEGFASFAANQFCGMKHSLSQKNILQIITSDTRVYYLYFGQIIQKMLEKTNLMTALKNAGSREFKDWVTSLMKEDDCFVEDKSMNQLENELEITYLDSSKRDLVLILPGGGYTRTSPRESDPVASRFRDQGYHTAIYYYRNQLLRHPFLIEEGIEKVLSIKKDPLVERIIIIGFSAGGHYALHLLEKIPSQFRAGILCYPVVTTNPSYIHDSSFRSLFGRKLTREESKEVSLEKHVNDFLPPIYLWHTMDDQAVKVENSLLLLNELRAHHILTEFHIFPTGPHGLSLADETTPFDGVDPIEYKESYKHISVWFDEAIRFLKDLN